MDQFVVRELQRSLANSTLEQDPVSELEKSAGEIRLIFHFQNRIQIIQFSPFHPQQHLRRLCA